MVKVVWRSRTEQRRGNSGCTVDEATVGVANVDAVTSPSPSTRRAWMLR